MIYLFHLTLSVPHTSSFLLRKMLSFNLTVLTVFKIYSVDIYFLNIATGVEIHANMRLEQHFVSVSH